MHCSQPFRGSGQWFFVKPLGNQVGIGITCDPSVAGIRFHESLCGVYLDAMSYHHGKDEDQARNESGGVFNSSIAALIYQGEVVPNKPNTSLGVAVDLEKNEAWFTFPLSSTFFRRALPEHFRGKVLYACAQAWAGERSSGRRKKIKRHCTGLAHFLGSESEMNGLSVTDDEPTARCWVEEMLPNELLSLVLKHLPQCDVAPAARTCRRWFSCSPPELRRKLSLQWACSSLTALQWAHPIPPQLPECHSRPAQLVCQHVAANGCLGALQWARANGYPWNDRVCMHAAENGHLEVLKWARENGCPWNAMTCTWAARGGHLEVLRWARENGCPWNAMTCSEAARNGHLEVLQWARENGCPWNQGTFQSAAGSGRLEVLKWLKENGCPWSYHASVKAVVSGQMEVLKWLKENGCPWNEWTCAAAAEHGHLHVLKWLHENGCPWDDFTCANAAANGDLEMLKWAREKGCPWSISTYGAALENEYFEVAEWAKENGCPWEPEDDY
ncbi:Ankyrin repeat-containing domain [Balamuthia mandrillaris]